MVMMAVMIVMVVIMMLIFFVFAVVVVIMLFAVIVLVGAFNVYFKMQNGDQDVKKTVMMTIGGCVAFVAMSEALPMFFK